jgi:GNAT superfamily N-acetyltransferase
MSRPATARPARPEDYPHFVRLFAELGVPEPPPEIVAWTAAYMGRTLIMDDGEPVVFAYYDLLPRCGYVRNIAVAPSHRRQGLGRAMMRTLAQRFSGQGCDEWRLNVKHDNHAAIALYQACGMAEVYRTTSLSTPIEAIARLPEAPRPVRVRPLQRADDAAGEALFDMPHGLMTSLRDRPGAEFYQLLDESRAPAECVGVTRFSPDMPGAFPFRLTRPDFVRPLLEFLAARVASYTGPGTGPGTRPINLACEDQPDLVAALVAAGATVNMEIVHMRGLLAG